MLAIILGVITTICLIISVKLYAEENGYSSDIGITFSTLGIVSFAAFLIALFRYFL